MTSVLCDSCVEHNCTTPEWNHCVTECDDYKGTPWIAVWEAMPIGKQWVLVLSLGSFWPIAIARHNPEPDFGGWFSTHGYLPSVTHWQPLPRLPR